MSKLDNVNMKCIQKRKEEKITAWDIFYVFKEYKISISIQFSRCKKDDYAFEYIVKYNYQELFISL